MDRLKYLMGLMVACPHIEALNNCPFKEFRDSPIDKLIWQHNNMDFHQSMQMIEVHKNCTRKRNNYTKQEQFM